MSIGGVAGPRTPPTNLQQWAPDAAVGVLVLFAGLFEIFASSPYWPDTPRYLFVVLGFAVAAGLSRRMPAAALALVWATCVIQLLTSTPVLLIQVSVAVVAFGTARWGRAATVWLSGLSVPAAALLLFGYIVLNGLYMLSTLGSGRQFLDLAYRMGATRTFALALIASAVLGIPFLAGLTLRFMDRAQRSEVSQAEAEQDAARAQREYQQAAEIARLREEQARMARDVHDVVGHSLAVILAQAESAQFLPDDDPDGLKRTMATIATSARTSLQDVRQVLSATQQEAAPPSPGGLDQLIEGVRASGHEVLSQQVGTPQPLPPELAEVAFRVLQEMLTNAIRHGRRDQPVFVERHWPDGGFDQDLRIEVRNVEDSPDVTLPLPTGDAGGGHGLEGMRRRLDSVGGRLDVRRRDEPAGPSFTVTAWVPVRGGR